MSKAYYCGRRPKNDSFDAPEPSFLSEEDDDIKEDVEEDVEEEVDEEVDFDKPSFGRNPIWSDYGEDMDFDQ